MQNTTPSSSFTLKVDATPFTSNPFPKMYDDVVVEARKTDVAPTRNTEIPSTGSFLVHKILEDQDYDYYNKLELKNLFQDTCFTHLESILGAIKRYVKLYDKIPNFDQVYNHTNSDKIKEHLIALELNDYPDEDIDVVWEQLNHQEHGNRVLDIFDKKLLENWATLEMSEVQDVIRDMATMGEEKLEELSNNPSCMAMIPSHSVDDSEERVYLGLNNNHDASGVYKGDYLLLGGKRGSGKTIVCANLVCNQYKLGSSVVMFTSEDGAEAIAKRIKSILTGIPHSVIQGNTYTEEQKLIMAKSMTGMFEGASELLDNFSGDLEKLEVDLQLDYLALVLHQLRYNG